jgi:hypothetical protein
MKMFPFHPHSQFPTKSPIREVPWDFIAPHEKQAMRNHDQTLERLAERGGLSPAEMLAAVSGQNGIWIMEKSDQDAYWELLGMVKVWHQKNVEKLIDETGIKIKAQTFREAAEIVRRVADSGSYKAAENAIAALIENAEILEKALTNG